MDYGKLFETGLNLLEFVLNRYGAQQASEQVDDAKAALAKLKQFHGTPVTQQQLDSLRD